MSNLLPISNSSSIDDGDPNQKRAKLISNLILAVPIMAVIYFIFPFLTGLINNITDLMTAIIKGGTVLVIGIVLFLIFKALQKGFLHALEKLNSRWLDAVISNNPTESMRIEIAKAVKQKEKRSESLGKITSKIEYMEEIEKKQNTEMLRQLQYASAQQKLATESSDKTMVTKYKLEAQKAANNANYKKESNERLKPTLIKYREYASKMAEIASAMEFFIGDMTNLCEQLEQDWKLSKDLKETSETINDNLGLNDANSIYRRASRIAQQDIINNMATVESAFERSKEIVAKAATEKGIMELGANQLLDSFNSGEFDLLIQSMSKTTSLRELKERAIIDLQNGSSDNNTNNQTLHSEVSQFDELFKRNKV